MTRWHLAAGYIALNLVLVAVGLWVNYGLHRGHPSRAAATRSAGSVERSPARPPKTRQRPAKIPTRPRQAAAPRRSPFSPPLLIVASRGPSWILVRRGSAGGPVVYDGVLDRGKVLRLPRRAVYLRASVASNLDVRFGARASTLPCYAADGTIVTQQGAVPVQAAPCLSRLGS